jgi:GNAT superfamily N-acetyltransferase
MMERERLSSRGAEPFSCLFGRAGKNGKQIFQKKRRTIKMTIRKPEPRDREDYLAMSKEFYSTDAVLQPVPEENFAKTFDLLLSGSLYADAYFAEEDGKAAGYALLSFSWSNEAGGMVVWLEEIYVRPKFRGTGVGSRLIGRIFRDYGGKAVRFRLETEDSNTGARRLYERLGFRDFPYRQMKLETAKG